MRKAEKIYIGAVLLEGVTLFFKFLVFPCVVMAF